MGREGTLPALAPFNKEQTPLAILRYQPAVSRRLFRCLGAHLPRSPSIVKSGSGTRACSVATVGQTPPVENLGSPAPIFVLCQVTSSRCRFSHSHSLDAFRCYWFHLARCMGKQKTLLTFGKQGWKNSILRVTCLPCGHPDSFWDNVPNRRIGPG